jgi:DNA-binding transcriptional LysR family regulator
LPDYVVANDLGAGRLVELLPGYRLPDGGIHAVYPGKQPSVKVRAFIDLLREKLAS